MRAKLLIMLCLFMMLVVVICNVSEAKAPTLSNVIDRLTIIETGTELVPYGLVFSGQEQPEGWAEETTKETWLYLWPTGTDCAAVVDIWDYGDKWSIEIARMDRVGMEIYWDGEFQFSFPTDYEQVTLGYGTIFV